MPTVLVFIILGRGALVTELGNCLMARSPGAAEILDRGPYLGARGQKRGLRQVKGRSNASVFPPQLLVLVFFIQRVGLALDVESCSINCLVAWSVHRT